MRPFSGARWWTFDFHAHTPASSDYGKGKDQSTLQKLEPREWLLAFMRAGIDCVAITDHNSGEWIDTLQAELEELRKQASSDYRPLTLFPGVEITSNSDVHMLALFEPRTPKAHIDQLLGAVRLQASRGEGTAVEASTIDVADHVRRLGGVTILAHVDKAPNGANTKDGGNNSLAKLIESGNIDAVELCDSSAELKPALRDSGLPHVLGSDCHHPDGSTGPKYPGSHFTWVKMGDPTLEGLRLALIDGNGGSVIRSDSVPVDANPNTAPAEWIESIEIERAKVIGNGAPAALSLNPWLNTIVGGRGTGKSTIVHFTRAALQRIEEVQRLPDASDTRQDVERFFQDYESRNGPGVLREDTEARLVFHHAGKRFRIIWNQKQSRVEEESVPSWSVAFTQSIRDRFPIRIFSQGQILEMTRSSASLLEFIDDASGAATVKKQIEEEASRFMTLRATARELAQKAAQLDAAQAQLEDVQYKLVALESSQHADVLREHQRSNRQLREMELARDEAQARVKRIYALASELALPDISRELFESTDEAQAQALASWESLQRAAESAASAIRQAGDSVAEAERRFTAEAIDQALRPAADDARARYESLVNRLRSEGVSDPAQFGVLVQERQRLETEVKNLRAAAERAAETETEAKATLDSVCVLRENLWKHRQQWIDTTLRGNNFVRISVEPYGGDLETAERSFRELISVTDDRFAADILQRDAKSGNLSGLIADLYRDSTTVPNDRCKAVGVRLKELQGLITDASSFGGHFNNFLAKQRDKRPELIDRLLLWSPEDGVRIEYSPKGDGKDFRPISQGSAGQRSAAVLAFFLAYGDEPIVLDQPEDDLDNHLIYDLIVQQLRESKKRRQIIVVTHNPNIVVNGYAENVFVMDFKAGQCVVAETGCLQDHDIREEVFKVMEGGRDAFIKRFRRLDGGRSLS